MIVNVSRSKPQRIIETPAPDERPLGVPEPDPEPELEPIRIPQEEPELVPAGIPDR